MCAEGRGHNGRDKMEERNQKPFRRPQMMGKVRGEQEKEEDYCVVRLSVPTWTVIDKRAKGHVVYDDSIFVCLFMRVLLSLCFLCVF